MDKKLGVAIVGISYEGIGNLHMKSVINNLNTYPVILCDINEEHAKDRSELYGVPYCTDYHDILTMDEVDIAIICTPDNLHADTVCDFLEAGKHVLCEKPLALNTQDCQKMLDAEKKSSAKLMVGQVCRKTPAFIKAKQIVDEGIIGELAYIESEYSHNYENMRLHWRNSFEVPRHGFVGGACHSVDLLRWYAGNPIEVFGYGNHKLLDPKFGPCDDTVCALMKFPNDVVGRVFLSIGCNSPGTGVRTLLYGTKGTIIMSAVDSHLKLYLREFNFENRDAILNDKTLYHNAIEIPVSIDNHNTTGELEELIDIILNDNGVKITAREGADTVAVCEAVIKSTQTGMPQKVEYCK